MNDGATATVATIRIRGREYQVSRHDRTNSANGKIETGYRFVGKRGASYFTMRNVRRPELMFVVSHALASRTMDGVWLSDEGGVLRVVSQ